MFLVSSWSCLYPIQWSQVLSQEWWCSWSSADRRCSNYTWVITNCIVFSGVSYIRGLMVTCGLFRSIHLLWCNNRVRARESPFSNLSWATTTEQMAGCVISYTVYGRNHALGCDLSCLVLLLLKFFATNIRNASVILSMKLSWILWVNCTSGPARK